MPRTAMWLTPLCLCVLALLFVAALVAACEPDAPTPARAPTATTAPVHRQASAATDRDALTALYRATGGDSWSTNTNWLSDAPIGQWHGVSTDDNGRVAWLLLHNNQLSGEIPPELGNLANLQQAFSRFESVARGAAAGVGQPRQPETTVAQ